MSNNPDTYLAEAAAEEGMYSVDVYTKDTDGDYITPDAVAWTLTDLAGTIINSRTSVAATPGNPTRITLSGDDLALASQASDYEIRLLLVRVTEGANTATMQKRFCITNLNAVT
jgi:hypothetical protein